MTFADVDEAAGQQTAGELAAAGIAATFCRADITVEADVRRAIEGVVARHGTLDVLVNNAGVNAYYDATAMTEAEWNRVFDVDLKGAWLCAKYALQPMKRAGRGSIVNIASIHASLTIAGMFPYAAAKAGPARTDPQPRARIRSGGHSGQRRAAGLYAHAARGGMARDAAGSRGDGAARDRHSAAAPDGRAGGNRQRGGIRGIRRSLGDHRRVARRRLRPRDHVRHLIMECVLDAKAELGEGPVWDPVAACLYFVDIELGLVHRYDPETRTSRALRIGTLVGAVALTGAGDLLLAVHDGFVAPRSLHGPSRAAIADVESDRPDQRMNDGKCDPAGRFWAGTMAIDERRGAGALVRLDADGRVHAMLDRRHHLQRPRLERRRPADVLRRHADAHRLTSSTSTSPTGTIANRRSLARVAAGAGWPDGLTLDADGYLWVALWSGGAVRRYAPDGTLDRVVPVPVSHPTSCAFGGPDLGDLYITTAATALTPDASALREPLAGGLFRCRARCPRAAGPPVQGLAVEAVAFQHIDKSFGAVAALRDVTFAVAPGECARDRRRERRGQVDAAQDSRRQPAPGPRSAACWPARRSRWRTRAMRCHAASDWCTRRCSRFRTSPSPRTSSRAARSRDRFGWLREAEMRARSRELLARLQLPISPDASVDTLPIAHRQLLQVARALAFDCRMLALDEPTTSLTARGDGSAVPHPRRPQARRRDDRVRVASPARGIPVVRSHHGAA